MSGLTLDVFNNDAFSLVSLTKAINDIPYQPSLIGDLGLFTEEGIQTTTFSLERMGSEINLVPSGTRGSSGRVEKNDKRKLVSMSTVHLPQRAGVSADEVRNLRAFGSENGLEAVQTVVNRKLMKMRRNLDTTIEWQRIGAIKGQVLDADGTSVLLDMNNAFGLTHQDKALDLSNTASLVRSEIVQAKRLIEVALGGLMYTDLIALCSADFFDAFVEHPAVQRAWDNFQDRMMLQQDLRSGFRFGNVQFREYRGNIGGHDFVASGEAWLVPLGVPDLFVTNYAPADYMETVNTIGLPYYAKQELRDFNKGVEIETQSNPISFCTRPNTIVRLTA